MREINKAIYKALENIEAAFQKGMRKEMTGKEFAPILNEGVAVIKANLNIKFEITKLTQAQINAMDIDTLEELIEAGEESLQQIYKLEREIDNRYMKSKRVIMRAFEEVEELLNIRIDKMNAAIREF